MVQERIPMNVVMEMLTLTYQEKLSKRKIALRLGISRLSVQKYQEQARESGIDEWPLSKDADGGVERLRKALYPEKTVSVLGMPLPDWIQAEKELRSGKKNGVTRRLLWQEYRMGSATAGTAPITRSSGNGTISASIFPMLREKNSPSTIPDPRS